MAQTANRVHITGFSIAPLVVRRSPACSAATMGVEEAASNCLEEGCSIDAVGDLLTDLKAESKALSQKHQARTPSLTAATAAAADDDDDD